jgi:hypothetical protein
MCIQYDDDDINNSNNGHVSNENEDKRLVVNGNSISNILGGRSSSLGRVVDNNTSGNIIAEKHLNTTVLFAGKKENPRYFFACVKHLVNFRIMTLFSTLCFFSSSSSL